LSGLAEGADMLVAQEALKLGIDLIAVLPYEKEKYLQSFSDEDNILEFEKLFKKAKERKVLEKTNEGAYVELAKYLAKHSNILLALWDGDRSEIKPGGTADVIKRKEEYEVENKLDINEDEIIVHIVTPRKPKEGEEKKELPKDAYTIKKIFMGRGNEKTHKNILKHIDNLNANLANKNIDKEKGYLDNLKNIFSNMADKFQEEFNNSSLKMLLAAFLAVLFVEIMHNFGPLGKVGYILEAIVGIFYFFIVTLMFLYYFLLKDKELKNHYAHSRGLSEALRIQKKLVLCR
jgi:magnesium-transporting ATPase (P-type)